MRTVLCYRRKSIVRQDSDLVSPAKQKQAVSAFVSLLGDDVRMEWYEDIDGHRSGRSEEGRPGWLALKRQLKRADVLGVACYSLSRIYRNVREFLEFVDELNRLGLRLIVVKEAIDTATPAGMAINTILMALYQLESDLASERMTETIAFKRREMRQHWGPVPFGTLRDEEQHLIADPKTVGTVRRLFELFATGRQTYDSLCAQINGEGLDYVGRDGEARQFTRDDIRRTLCMWRLYSGAVTIGSNRDDEAIVAIHNAHAPIVDARLCAQVAAQLDRRRKRFTKRSSNTHMLSGLIYCATCGAELSSTTTRGVRRYRHRGAKDACPETWVEAEALEQELVARVARLWSDEAHAAIAAGIDALLSELPDAAAAQVAIREAEGCLERLIDLYLDGRMHQAEYLRRSREIEARLADAQGRRQVPTATAIEEAATRLNLICTSIEELPLREQRELLLTTFERVTVHDGHVYTLEPQDWLTEVWRMINPGL